MADHIVLTSLTDGSAIIVDRSRIILCEMQHKVDKEKYSEALKQFEHEKNSWRDRQEKENPGVLGLREWSANNPSPDRPNPRDEKFYSSEKYTLITLTNNTTIDVIESTEEIFKKIKTK